MSYHQTDTSRDLEQVYMEYHQQLVPEFISATKQNISQRITKMIDIINKNSWISSKSVQFTIDIEAMTTQAMERITPIIQSNTLVDVSACKTPPNSMAGYRKIARNRLNRNKPKFVGNFVFGPLIFDHLYSFCCQAFGENGIIAFVSMLSDVLCPQSMIRFEQTRAQPIIPYNTLVMDNAFRSSCVVLLKHYNLETEWDPANQKTLSAKDKWHCFITECLPKLAQRCCWPQYQAPQCLFIADKGSYTTRSPIIPIDHIPPHNTVHLEPNPPPQAAYRYMPVRMEDAMVPEYKSNTEQYIPSVYGYNPDTPMRNQDQYPSPSLPIPTDQMGSQQQHFAFPPQQHFAFPQQQQPSPTHAVYVVAESHMDHNRFCDSGSANCMNYNYLNYGNGYNNMNIPVIPFNPSTPAALDHDMRLQRQPNNHNINSHRICDAVEHTYTDTSNYNNFNTCMRHRDVGQVDALHGNDSEADNHFNEQQMDFDISNPCMENDFEMESMYGFELDPFVTNESTPFFDHDIDFSFDIDPESNTYI